MSHLVTVEVQIKDPDAAADAASELGWEFHRNATEFKMWGGSMVPCEHKIVIPGCSYEIGLVKSQDGTHLELSYDDLAGTENKEGRYGYLRKENGMQGFLPAYQRHVLRKSLKKKGIRFTEKQVKGKDGKSKTRIEVLA